MQRPRLLLSLAAPAILLAQLAAIRPAQACGGFFCNQPDSTGVLPIAQAAENVLFVLDRDPETGQGRVEAHIQILYKGTADQFSWVVPVTATPTLDVGSDLLFDRIEALTRPRYQLTWTQEGLCQGQGGGGGGGFACGAASSSARGAGGLNGPGGVDQPAVQVLFRGNVGPFDSAVIKSEDPEALKSWLTANNYFVSPDASAIINDYVASRSSFVALRLQQGLDTSAIKPIILRLPSEEGCLPLKLTAIAATPDLRINVWVLGDGRGMPINYTEINLNFAKLDWFGAGKNYEQLLGQAADEAGGNAFSVEYAEPTFTVAGVFAGSDFQRQQLQGAFGPGQYLSLLAQFDFPLQGAVLDVVRKALPMPADVAARGVSEADYYKNINQYWPSAGSPKQFDPIQLTRDLTTAVFTPLQAFVPLLQKHRTLTRLATFISPEEMTKDPVFITNRALPEVSPLHKATATMLCGDQAFDVCHAPVKLTTAEGTDVVYAVAAGAPATCDFSVRPIYERGDLDSLPASTTGFARAADGADTMSVDNRAAIAAALTSHNKAVPRKAPGADDGCSVPGRARGALPVLGVLAWALVVRRRRRR